MKTNLHKFFKTDKQLEENGVWFDISETTGFLLRPFKATNPRVKEAVARHFKPYARQIELGTMSQEKTMEIMVNVFIDICLVDWKGVEGDGQELECTPENARKIFMELPDLFEALFEHAKRHENYREDVGNF